jgi:hypothetical protein
MSSPLQVATCGAVCAASAPDPKKCLALNYSPWYAKFPGKDPTVTGAPERAEIDYYDGLLTNISHWLADCKECAGVGIGAVLLDSEKFSSSPGTPIAVSAALTRKCDLIFNATMAVFPATRVEWYNRGAVSRSFTYGWIGPTGSGAAIADHEWNHFTLDELGHTFSTSIYDIRDLFLMRETYRRTVAVAIAHNSSGPSAGLTTGVTPWLALGCGDRLLATHNCSGHEQRYNEPCSAFYFASPYDPVLSWQLGNEINNLSQYTNTEHPSYTASQAFAPWDKAEVVCLYPSILDSRASPTAGGSTSMVDHLVAYVRGAGGFGGVSGAANGEGSG